MKLRFLVIALFFLTFFAFSQPAGLSFYGRYLTDKELDERPPLKVKIPLYNEFEHEALTDKDDYTFALNTYYNYKTRHFIVEQDANGIQWIHLSAHTSSERINSVSKYAKSQILNRVYYDFKTPRAISFDWCAKITNPPQKGASNTIIKITAISHIPNSVPAYLVCSDRKIYLKVKEYDLRESYEKRNPTDRIKLCYYKYGEILHIRLEVNNNTVSAYINGEKKGEYKFEHELWGNWQMKLSNAHEHFGDFFNEAFFSNIKVEEL